ncbi:MAG: hypothetical protein NTV93_18535 [Verrucomicrobia bacterium]|nr:hypothetical protein [Verrucomicrobiota bacterium]
MRIEPRKPPQPPRRYADNRAGSPLAVRIAFNGLGGWFYSGAQTITNSTGGADWTLLSFSLDAGSFTYVSGSGV